MESLLAHQAERIIFINVHRPIGWDAIAHTRQAWFIKDQTHLSFLGSKAYITAIQEILETTP